MTTLDEHKKAEETISQLIGYNNNLLASAAAIDAITDKVDALTPPQRTAFDAALPRGLRPADFDALVASLKGRVADIQANLTEIATKL